MNSTVNLLDEALGLNDIDQTEPSSNTRGRVVLIEDCVETSGSFLLHHLIKRSLSPQSSGVVIFVAFAQPFSHYDRILRKMGCNLLTQRDNKRFLFLDMLMLECPDGDGETASKGGILLLYRKIQKAVEDGYSTKGRNITVIIDDISLMEVAAHGSSNHVLNFLHYCHTLTSQYGCSLVTLNHRDIYSRTDRPSLILQMEYLADTLIKAEPLATGLATDVHGQLTVMNKGICDGSRISRNKMRNFHFRVKENSVEYFYPGTRT
ncbi:unnamed protein product [Ilex paraguariensis]|uniref:Elongator complex protein 6 n=1 Tax=Ilex paraguariensis TaxID=185542 RepID=A0ABC8RGU6_9AQUA